MTGLEVGADAPDFELRDQHGQRVRLSSYRGHKDVVLVFYPSAFSPVCSSELSTLRTSWPALDRPDVELVTVARRRLGRAEGPIGRPQLDRSRAAQAEVAALGARRPPSGSAGCRWVS